MEASAEWDVVRVRRLRLSMSIGVLPSEREARQEVWVSVAMRAPAALRRAGGYVSYAPVVEALEALAAAGHVDLVEQVAEHAARAALSDENVAEVEVTVEKPEIFAAAESVGVTIRMDRLGFEAS